MTHMDMDVQSQSQSQSQSQPPDVPDVPDVLDVPAGPDVPTGPDVPDVPDVPRYTSNNIHAVRSVLRKLQDTGTGPTPGRSNKHDDPIHDFLEIGLSPDEQKLIIENIKKNTLNPGAMILNPFFVPLKGGSALAIPGKDFYSVYSYCYALLVRSDIPIDSQTVSQIYQRHILVEDLRDVLKSFTLIKTDIKILRNNRFKRVTNLINRPTLDAIFNHHGVGFQEMEFVVPLFNLSESNAMNYLSLFQVPRGIDSLSSIMSTMNLFNSNYMGQIDQSVDRLIQGIDPTPFWTLARNCNFPLFEIFNDRSFTYNGMRLDRIKVETLESAKDINHLIREIEHTDATKRIRRLGPGSPGPGSPGPGSPGPVSPGLVSPGPVSPGPVSPGPVSPGPGRSESPGYELPGHGVGENPREPDRFTKAEFQNLYMVLKNQKGRTFYVNPSNPSVTPNDIADIFDRITDERYRFKLFNTLLVSKEYWHLVYNNRRVLARNADIIRKYRPVYAYLMAYPHATAYLEESVLGTRATRYHRHAFDLETAHLLPSFPFTKTNLRRNPYLTLLLPDDVIDPMTNLVGLHTPYDHEKYMGLASPEEAMRRFNIFCTGDPDKNLFDIDETDKTIFSVSGSIMPACLQKLSPLFEKCTTPDTPYVKRWQTFFNHFYSESDIDLMCKCGSVTQLIAYGTKMIRHIGATMNVDRSDIRIAPCKKSAIIITKHFFSECLDDVNGALGTHHTEQELIGMFDQIGMSQYTDDFKQIIEEYFYVDYCNQKQKRNLEWRESTTHLGLDLDKELMRSFTSLGGPGDIIMRASLYAVSEAELRRKDSEIYFFINDFRADEDKVPPEENYIVFKYSESLKFKIRSTGIPRDIEMFQIDAQDPFNTVGRFHMPCVRAYYQDHRFYLLPSFITAMHTGINIDYKYFAGSRDPVNICHKYLTRGFGMILNDCEKKGMFAYSSVVDEYNGMYRVRGIQDLFGPKDVTHRFFCPGVYKLGIDPEVYQIHGNLRYAETDADIAESYRDSCGYDPRDPGCPIDVLRLNPIDKTGNITPYKPWVGDAFYDYMNPVSAGSSNV